MVDPQARCKNGLLVDHLAFQKDLARVRHAASRQLLRETSFYQHSPQYYLDYAWHHWSELSLKKTKIKRILRGLFWIVETSPNDGVYMVSDESSKVYLVLSGSIYKLHLSLAKEKPVLLLLTLLQWNGHWVTDGSFEFVRSASQEETQLLLDGFAASLRRNLVYSGNEDNDETHASSKKGEGMEGAYRHNSGFGTSSRHGMGFTVGHHDETVLETKQQKDKLAKNKFSSPTRLKRLATLPLSQIAKSPHSANDKINNSHEYLNLKHLQTKTSREETPPQSPPLRQTPISFNQGGAPKPRESDLPTENIQQTHPVDRQHGGIPPRQSKSSKKTEEVGLAPPPPAPPSEEEPQKPMEEIIIKRGRSKRKEGKAKKSKRRNSTGQVRYRSHKGKEEHDICEKDNNNVNNNTRVRRPTRSKSMVAGSQVCIGNNTKREDRFRPELVVTSEQYVVPATVDPQHCKMREKDGMADEPHKQGRSASAPRERRIFDKHKDKERNTDKHKDKESDTGKAKDKEKETDKHRDKERDTDKKKKKRRKKKADSQKSKERRERRLEHRSSSVPAVRSEKEQSKTRIERRTSVRPNTRIDVTSPEPDRGEKVSSRREPSVVRGALIDLTGKSSMKMNLADVSSPKVKDSKVDKKRREAETNASEYKGISRSRTVSKEKLEEKEDSTLERHAETDKATRESKWTTHEGDLYDTVTPNSSVKVSQKLGSTSSPRSSRSIHTDNSPTTIIPSKAEKVLLRHLNLMAMQSSSPSSSDSQKPRDDYWIFFKGVLYGPENPVPLTKNPTNMQYLKVLVFAIKDNATIPATLFVDEQSASEKLCALVNTTKIHFVDFDSAEGFTDPHTQIAKEILREHGVPIV